ncbi:AmmeMemoRadiSam system protein A [Ruminiclostridium herbifermentans]|uniref:AmmeMemoRadiSam system protein A n=1 Tax=Ruminiclostridium herbifermentans TaxID=2488810 RepID=A0A4V6EPG6_9FIRM|nr:AmmeMemoRadiSam system protein A [Ruminiclostridium herbifermentans]QNU68205.1 AmmeMemoRadiSam system protein A [Ruminiclostridium herbifermentans]
MKGYYLMPHPPLMVHEIGKGEEAKIQKTIDSCNAIGEEISQLNVDTIIIITPHGTIFRDAIAMIGEETLEGNLGKFGASKISFKLKIDTLLTNEIIKEAEKVNIPTVKLNKQNENVYRVKLKLDHGAAIPLYHIKDIDKYKIVHITYGMLAPIELYYFGMAIEQACKNTNTQAVLIASGDLSHRLTEDGAYPYSPYGKKFDLQLIDILRQGRISDLFNMDQTLINEAAECGLRSIYILAGALDGKEAKADILSYEGPFGVGYGVAKFNFKDGKSIYTDLKEIGKLKHLRRLKEGNAYTKLARRNLENYLKNGRPLSINDIKDAKLLNNRKGVFVSLKIKGELRGCIGTIEAVTPSIAEEIMHNSISAAFNDPRFPPLREDELFEIDISVDLLYPAQKCSFNELDPKNYGVIVTSGRKRGLLLPNLEGVNTKEEQISIALQKAGINPNEPYEIERFKVERFIEE